MKIQPSFEPSHSRPKHGAALIVTLLVLVLLVVIVTGFLSTTRVEQMASRNFTYQAQAQQMAMAGVQQAIAQLNDAFSNNATVTNFTTQPGLIIKDGQPIYLSSASVTNSGPARIDLNISNVNLIHPSTFASNTYVYWAPLVLLSNVSGGMTNLAGRYAYWVDDEGTKANLNAMDTNVRSSLLPTNGRPMVYTAIGTAGLANFAGAIDGSSNNSWPYFFTGSQLGLLKQIGISTAVQYGYFMAGGPGNLTNRLPMMTNGYTNINTDTDTVTTRVSKIDRPEITNKFKDSFQRKYQTNVIRQIVANIKDRPLAITDSTVTGIENITTNGDNVGIPTNYFGLRPSIYLNEIASAVYCSTNSSTIQPQLFIGIEVVNPYATNMGENSEIVLEIDQFRFEGSYMTNGVAVPIPPGGWSPPANLVFTNILTSDVPAKSYNTNIAFAVFSNISVAVPFSNVVVTNFVKIKTIKLRQGSNSNSIRDWAATNDLTNVWTNIINEPMQTVILSSVLGATNGTALPPYVNWSGANVNGIAKNDPRVRTFPDWITNPKAWITVSSAGITMGAQNSVVNYNSGTGINNIKNDPSAGAVAIWDHPSFIGTVNVGTNLMPYKTIMELGRVHTGLQWRTLQIRAQDSNEPAPPDWALLETYYVSNNLPKINVNSLQQQANTNAIAMTISDQASNNILRQKSLESLLSGGENNAAGAGFDANSQITNTPGLSSNIVQLQFRTNWVNKRASLNFSTNTFYSIGEVLEISNVSDFFTNNDYINEGRAAAFIDAITVASDTFMIYSYGEAVDASTNAVAEYRCRALVKYNTNHTPPKFEIVYVEPMPLP